MKENLKILTISIFFLFLTTTNSNAMPRISDVILFPFKVAIKPFIWLRYGYENKVDNYKVAITYNLEIDGKPLVVTKAINCDIYEGKFRRDSDGIKRPTRRVRESTRQVTHYLSETNETIILPVPGYCEVDRPYKEEKIANKNGKEKIKTIPIANKKKSFGKFSDKMIMSITMVKFDKEDPAQIDRIERIISPKYYESPNSRIKLKSYSFTTNTDLELVDPKVENRFSWINGKAKTDKLPKWGTYKDEDKGAYAAFGIFKYPKEIWSKIPAINEFITKLLKQNESNSTNENRLLHLPYDDSKYQTLGIKKALKDAKHYLAGSQYGRSLDRYFGGLGVNEAEPWIAIFLAKGTGIRIKGRDQKMFVPDEKRGEWQKLVKNSNYRDYYHPFTFNEEEEIWEEDRSRKGWLLIEKIQNPKSIDIKEKAYDVNRYGWHPVYNLDDNLFEGRAGMMALFYDSKTEELILPNFNSATYLK